MSRSDPEMAKSGGNFGPKSRDSDSDLRVFLKNCPCRSAIFKIFVPTDQPFLKILSPHILPNLVVFFHFFLKNLSLDIEKTNTFFLHVFLPKIEFSALEDQPFFNFLPSKVRLFSNFCPLRSAFFKICPLRTLKNGVFLAFLSYNIFGKLGQKKGISHQTSKCTFQGPPHAQHPLKHPGKYIMMYEIFKDVFGKILASALSPKGINLEISQKSMRTEVQILAWCLRT